MQGHPTRIQASRVSRFRFLGNALWDMRSRKVSTNSRISAITEYSFQLRVCFPLTYAVFFHWNTSFTRFILVSNSINWWVNQFFGTYVFGEKKKCDKTLWVSSQCPSRPYLAQEVRGTHARLHCKGRQSGKRWKSCESGCGYSLRQRCYCVSSVW